MDQPSKRSSRYRHIAIFVLIILLVGASLAFWQSASKKDSGQTVRNEEARHTVVVQPQRIASSSSPLDHPELETVQRPWPDERAQFQSNRRCIFAMRAEESMQSQLAVCDKNEKYRGDASYAEYFESCKKRRAEFLPSIALAEQNLLGCNEDRKAAEEDFFSATKSTAKAGDSAAQVCYVSAMFDLGRPWKEQEKNEYSTLIPGYIEEAFRRGDWNMVEVLRAATPRDFGQPSLPNNVKGVDRISTYKLNRLLRLGSADTKYTQLLDAMPAGPSIVPTPNETADANAWANRTFELHFKNAPALKQTPAACLSSAGPYVPELR